VKIKRFLARLVLAITRWRVAPPVPDARHFVLIAAPHTSNWDLLHLLSLAWSVGIPVSWMGKHQLFRGPMGPLMRALGGIPVRRDRRNDLVAQVAALFRESDELVVVVPPEATRGRAEYWKSGFYRIAQAASVPVYMGYLDYATCTGGFGAYFVPSGDLRADMDIVRAFYADKRPRHPECFGPMRLREEGPTDSES